MLAVTSRILRQHGYPTLEAGTGDEALPDAPAAPGPPAPRSPAT